MCVPKGAIEGVNAWHDVLLVSVARAMPARITKLARTIYRGPGARKQWALRQLGIGEGWNAAHLGGFRGAGNRAELDANRQTLRG